jgi:hypothetical protein
MDKRILLAALAAAVALRLGTAAAPGDDQTPADKPPAQGAAPEPSPALRPSINDLQLALRLVHYARAHKTPEGLVTAALILHRTPTQPLQLKVEGAKQGPAESALAPKALLEEARGMRQDDKALAGVVDRARDELKEAPRGGGVNGPGRGVERVSIGSYSVAPRGVAQFRVSVPKVCDIFVFCLPPPAPVPALTVTGPKGQAVVPEYNYNSNVGWTHSTFSTQVPGDYLLTVSNPTNASVGCCVTTYK